VFGAGTIGLLVAAVAKINSARTVVIVDVDQGRCDFATKYGFAHRSYTTSVKHGKDIEETMKIAQGLAQSIKSSPGHDGNSVGEFDVAFECSGAPACLQAAIYVSYYCH
jgi:L-iditol 2-dehydrogenase